MQCACDRPLMEWEMLFTILMQFPSVLDLPRWTQIQNQTYPNAEECASNLAWGCEGSGANAEIHKNKA